MRIGRIQVRGRLVGQHDRRSLDDRPADRDTLALTSGKLVRPGFARSASPTISRASMTIAFRRCEALYAAAGAGNSTFS